LWRSLDVSQIALSRFSPAGYAVRHAAELLPERRDLITAFEQAEPFGRNGMVLFCTMPVPPCTVDLERFPSIRFGTCPIGTSMQEFALGSDGMLRHCTLHASAIGGVSDILDDNVDLDALVQHSDIAEYRRKIPDFCVGCVHSDTCAGGCGAAAFWVLGDARRYPDPLVMQHVDDDFGARLERERTPQKTRLEVIL
jgi:radical SAM protein with 4Fe4S-binding SPASM domain